MKRGLTCSMHGFRRYCSPARKSKAYVWVFRWWARRDLNPGSPAPKAGALSWLGYGPNLIGLSVFLFGVEGDFMEILLRYYKVLPIPSKWGINGCLLSL